MSLLSLFQWFESSRVGEAIRVSPWLFPVIESVHLLAFAVIAAAVLVVDLRLMGMGLRDQPVDHLAFDAQPWLIGSLSVMLITGFLLFLSESIKCYYSLAFWVKMTSLALAILFTFTIKRKVTLSERAHLGPVWMKIVGATSVTLWSGVGWGGRWIGFGG